MEGFETMKKLLCMVLAIVIMFALLIPVSAKDGIICGDTFLTVNSVASAVIKQGYASIGTTFTNNTSEDVSVTMVMTEYTENGGYKKLVNRSSEKKTVPAGKTVYADPGINIVSEKALVQYFAYETETLEPIEVGQYIVDNMKCIGTKDNETIYNIFSFDDIFNPEIDNSEVEALSAPSVCVWQGDRASATSITMDDGDYGAALKYLDLFKKYNIHGTEMIVTGWLGRLADSHNKWQAIFDTGYIDLGNHSYTHAIKYNDTSSYTQEELEHDIIDSYNELAEAFPTQSIITYATPWGQNHNNAITLIKKNHYANRSAGGDIVAGKTPADFYEIPTVAVQYGTPVSRLNDRVDRAIASGGWNTELYHGIGGAGTASDAYSTNIATMEEHLKYIASKSDKVWAGSFTEVVKYIYERDTASAKQLWANNSSIGIKLTDGMDDSVFDYPLTVKVNIPSEWSGSVKCTQYGKTETAEIFAENGKNYAYVNIVPDGGNAVISK